MRLTQAKHAEAQVKVPLFTNPSAVECCLLYVFTTKSKRNRKDGNTTKKKGSIGKHGVEGFRLSVF